MPERKCSEPKMGCDPTLSLLRKMTKRTSPFTPGKDVGLSRCWVWTTGTIDEQDGERFSTRVGTLLKISLNVHWEFEQGIGYRTDGALFKDKFRNIISRTFVHQVPCVCRNWGRCAGEYHTPLLFEKWVIRQEWSSESSASWTVLGCSASTTILSKVWKYSTSTH